MQILLLQILLLIPTIPPLCSFVTFGDHCIHFSLVPFTASSPKSHRHMYHMSMSSRSSIIAPKPSLIVPFCTPSSNNHIIIFHSSVYANPITITLVPTISRIKNQIVSHHLNICPCKTIFYRAPHHSTPFMNRVQTK